MILLVFLLYMEVDLMIIRQYIMIRSNILYSDKYNGICLIKLSHLVALYTA